MKSIKIIFSSLIFLTLFSCKKLIDIKETDFGVAFMLKGLGGLLGSYTAPMLEQYMRNAYRLF